jgi:hemolysin III
VFIGGSYTPFCLALPDGGGTLAAIVWGLCLTGIARAFLWVDAPHWLSTVHYLAVGWALVAYFPQMAATIGLKSTALLVIGGVLYCVGAVVFARRRPDPLPGHFGYHEVFHAFVVAASLCHLAAIVHALRLLDGRL